MTRFKTLHRLAVAFIAVFGVLTVSVASASAQSGWWHLSSTARPTYLAPEGEGQIVITAANLGDGNVEGGVTPVTFLDTLPAGLEAISISGGAVSPSSLGQPGCQLQTLTCTYSGEVPPYARFEIRIGVKVKKDAASGEPNEVSVSGGETRGASIARPITVSREPVPFGLQDNELTPEEEGGVPDNQAGSHPFQLTNTLVLNEILQSPEGNAVAFPAGVAKNIAVKLPPGLVGNPSPIPRCTTAQFFLLVHGNENACAANTAVGVATVTVEVIITGAGVNKFTEPVFNLEPKFGEPARFGFLVPGADVPVLLEPSVRSGNGEDYGITITSPNTTQTVNFLSSEITFWGVPGDPRHDNARGWNCLEAIREELSKGFPVHCAPLGDQHPQSLLTLPASCTGSPLQSSAELDSWTDPAVFAALSVTAAMPTLTGCNRLPFSPTVEAEPTTDRASAPSGLNVNLDFHDENLTSPEGLAQSQVKKVVVTLPEGLTINPSAGVGLAGCTPADFAREAVNTLAGEGCPNSSKLGTVTIETPLLPVPVQGSLYIAEPYNNPSGSLVALYIVARNPEQGILVKLSGKVSANPVTGQLTTTFDNNPQLPFGHFNFHFREGQQAPLVSPSTCGTYSTRAELTPWSEPLTELTDTASFTVTKGFEGGGCPSGGVPPFTPHIEAGTVNNNAGAFSPLYVHLTRSDGDAEISGFSTNMPPGLTGYLTGIPFCPEADIEAARHKTGAEEEANPSCPAATEIGHSLVGTGVGAVLADVPGKIYFAGPFDGASFSVVSITSAVVGPFDLGTVVLRFGLNINPYTAQVSVSPTSSEPIPTIIKGIVTHVRDIRVYIDRPKFIINPTNCDPLTIGSTMESNLGQRVTVTSPFQNASCGNLSFSPKFAVSTSGKTSRASGASLSVKLTYPLGAVGTYANIAKVKVDLPKQLPSRLTTLQKACTAAQFEANPAGCPPASFIGHAKAVTPLLPVPLEGPAIFVSHGGEAFPSLIMVLQGYGVTIDLVGSTNISKAGITSSTFKTVPDQPVGSFELTLPEGKYSALAANGNLCSLTKTVTVKKKVTVKVRGHRKTVTRKVKEAKPETLTMPTEFVAQNGAETHQNTKVSVTGCPKAKVAKKAKARKHKKGGKK
jgi:hypothetical protein